MKKKRVRITITLWVFGLFLILNLIGFGIIIFFALDAAKKVVLDHEKVDLGDDSNVKIGQLRRHFSDMEYDLEFLKDLPLDGELNKQDLRSHSNVFEVFAEFQNGEEKKSLLKDDPNYSLDLSITRNKEYFESFKDHCFDSGVPCISPPLLSRSNKNSRDERHHIVFYGGIKISKPGAVNPQIVLVGIRPETFNRFLRSPRHITFLLQKPSKNQGGSTNILWPSQTPDKSQGQIAAIQSKFSKWWETEEDRENKLHGNTELMDEPGAFVDFPYFHCLSKLIDLPENGTEADKVLSLLKTHVVDELNLKNFAISTPSKKDPRFRIRCHDEKMLSKIQREIANTPFNESPSVEFSKEDRETLAGVIDQCRWNEPLLCHGDGRYFFHCSRISLDSTQPVDGQYYFDVIYGVSALEMENDAKVDVMEHLWGPFGICAVVLLNCALVLSIYITQPIQQISKVARKVADEGVESPVEDELPTKNRSEIGELAQTFKNLLLVSRERTRRLVEQTQLLEEKTERLSEGEGRLRGILDTAAEGIVTVDQHETIQQANFAARKLMGVEQRRHVKGMPLCDVLVSASTGEGFQLSEQLEQSSSSVFNLRERYVLRQRTPEGSTREIPVEVCISRFRDLQELHFTFIIRDISEQLRTEVELAERVREKTLELEQKTQELEQALALRSQGLSQIVHELNVPLYAVTSSLEHIKSKFGDDPALGVRDAISGGERMHQVIESLRTLKMVGTKADPDESGFRLVRIDALVDDARRSLGRKIESASLGRVSVDTEPDLPWIEGHPDAFREVLLNLISNACKYTQQDETGTVHVSVRQLAPSTDWPKGALRVEVADNGIGIAEADQGRIFHEFFRSESAKECDPKGLGIGLAICRWFIRWHEGHIDFESSGEGLGTTFWFEVPLRRPRQVDRDKLRPFRDPACQALSNESLLLGTAVESVEVMMAERIEEMGLEIKLESDAEDLLEKLKQTKNAPYRLIYLTPHIESLNGFLAARAIHELEGYEETSIVLVGPHSREKARKEAGENWYDHPRCAYMAEHELLDEMRFWEIAYRGVSHRSDTQVEQ